MAQQIADGIYSILITLPNNPLKSLNVYVLTGERNLLVDTGFHLESCRQELLAGLAEIGVSMDDTDIFLTHLHSDHTGLAPELRGTDTKIFIGELDLPRMPGSHSTFSWAASDKRFAKEGFPWPLLETLTERNPAQGLSPVPYDDYIPVKDGDEFCYGSHRFRAMLTPGHTPGHMCLYEEETQICILGDHVLFDITPNISRWHDVEDSLGDYLVSLRKIRNLPVKLPLPAHRQVHISLAERCDQLIAHHQKRCDEVKKILSCGKAMTAWDIAAGMTWRIRAKNWEEFPTPQKWFAVSEALAHLDHLICLGIAEQQTDGEFNTYKLK